MTKYEKITKHGTGWTDQPCLYTIGERLAIGGNSACPDDAIWSVQSASVPLRSGGQKESVPHSHSGTVRGVYSKTGPQPNQTRKNHRVINGVIDQHSGKNGAGRIFIKTKPWRKKRGELNYSGLMTGLVGKSSPRLTVSLSLMLSTIIF